MYKKHTSISIIIPLFNSGKRIMQLYPSLKSCLCRFNDYEIIFVDDGSKDDTAEIIKAIKKQDLRVRIIQSEDNMGQYAALFAGYKCSKGDIVINIDDDAFEEADYIPEFIKKIEEGNDIVLGWRERKNYSFSRKAASFLFNIIVSLIAGKRIHDIGSSIKGKNRKAVDKVVSLGSLPHFLRYYKYYRIKEIRIPCNHPNEFPSRYYFSKLIKSGIFILKSNFLEVQN